MTKSIQKLIRATGALAIAAGTALALAGCAANHTVVVPLTPESAVQREANIGKYEKIAVIIMDPASEFIVDETGRPIRRNPKFTGTVQARGLGLKATIEAAFQMGLQRRGYTVAERSEVNAAMREMNFSNEFTEDTESIAKFGRAAKSDAVLTIRINRWLPTTRANKRGERFGWEAEIIAKLVHVKEATNLWMGTVNYPMSRSQVLQISGNANADQEAEPNAQDLARLCARILAEQITPFTRNKTK